MTNRSGPGGAGAKGPDELRQQIQRTRSQLGSTVEELAARVDVKGRALARAADLRDKAGAMTVQLRSSAAQAGHTVQERAARAGHTVQERAARAGHTVQERAGRAGHAVQDSAGHAGHAVERRVPRPARTFVKAGTRHPVPTLVVGAAGAALVVAGIWWRQRHARR
ncbi:DUF3618 domain-containing protein [Streptomyces sp. NPDC051636]|uniref:DUF3618 domain-containing protein n=1 Tax=Streptomyces sp. NPDC051636 TaxID=3365663 RepID=UPI00379E1CBE